MDAGSLEGTVGEERDGEGKEGQKKEEEEEGMREIIYLRNLYILNHLL